MANTVMFLRNIARGKAMHLPAPRRFLNQENCRFKPYILLVPLQAPLTVRDSDPLLHTVQMSASAARMNLPGTFSGNWNGAIVLGH